MEIKEVAEMIRTAIDTSPSGICISNDAGRVILANRKMNELIYRITGHTVVNARLCWEELKAFSSNDACRRLEEPWITDEISKEGAVEELYDRRDRIIQRMFFMFDESKVWRFRLEYLEEDVVQFTAAEITQLYLSSKELYENNLRLKQMQDRQKAMLKNIVEINEGKELLSAKMRIHDAFGECLIATRQGMQDGSIKDKAVEAKLKENWKRTLLDFSNIPKGVQKRNSSIGDELIQISELIGCHISHTGEIPDDERVCRLLFAAIREALTNAVEHAQATELYVAMEMIDVDNGRHSGKINEFGLPQETRKMFHAQLWDNGIAVGSNHPSPIREGNGLTALRSRLEQEGAAMQMLRKSDGGVMMVVDIPVNETDE